jgi:4-hydroxyphenylpyruvate dioxygenase-like putative hemolysin
MAQAVQNIDHPRIIVHHENVDKYASFLGDLLNINFDEPVISETSDVVTVFSWDSGIGIIAPLREESRYWEKLRKFGEGPVSVAFGVTDIDAAIKRVTDHGIDLDFEVNPEGVVEPWMKRFRHFREARLTAFSDDFAMKLTLSQIERVDQSNQTGE